ncbi:MAG: hypothetical protein DDT24_00614 [Chloroflexi bacterium]|nr:hypothetical protein [Chloroflexota bacterium]
MIRPLVVALREVRTYLQDRADLAFSLLLPIAIFALMYGAFGGQSLFHGTAHVVNDDQGAAYSALLLERLDKLESLDVELISSSEADSRLERADLLLVLYIPQDFSDKMASGEPSQLVLKQRGSRWSGRPDSGQSDSWRGRRDGPATSGAGSGAECSGWNRH